MLPSQHSKLAHHRPASETPFKYLNGVSLAGRRWSALRAIRIISPLITSSKKKTLVRVGPLRQIFLVPRKWIIPSKYGPLYILRVSCLNSKLAFVTEKTDVPTIYLARNLFGLDFTYLAQV